MLRIYNHNLEVLKEEEYLNKQLAKGWLFVGKRGPFYRFKKKAEEKQVVVEVVKPDMVWEESEEFQLIQRKHRSRYKLDILYYTCNEEDIQIERDDRLTLQYYRTYRMRIPLAFGEGALVVILLCVIVGILIQAFNLYSSELFLILMLISFPFELLLLFYGFKTYLKFFKMITVLDELGLKTNDFGKNEYIDMCRYRVTIQLENNKKIDNKELFKLLGSWRSLGRDNKQAYYRLATRASIEEIKEQVEEIFQLPEGMVEVVIPYDWKAF